MSLDIILILAAGGCGVAAIVDREHPWSGLGVLLLAISLLI